MPEQHSQPNETPELNETPANLVEDLVKDPEKARLMAYAERPYRDNAIELRAEGDKIIADNMAGYLDGEHRNGGSWNHQRSGLNNGDRALQKHRDAEANVENAKRIGNIAADAYDRLKSSGR